MKKKGGQKAIVGDLYPTLADKETEKKLAQIEVHSEAAKIYNDLMAEVKETIKGFVLGLSEDDQEVGKLQCGDFILRFKVTEGKETEVEFTRKAGKRVRIKFGKSEEEDKDGEQ
jgi:hypothetical protein